MDHLFSFPTGAQDVAAAMQASASDAPSNSGSNEPSAVAEAQGTATDDASEGVRLSEESGAVREQLHVRLKLLDERVFDVHVNHELSVAEFRLKVEETTAIPVHLQRLIYRGKLLKDGASLSSYEIQHGHMIHLVSKPVAAPPVASNVAAPGYTASEAETLDRFVGRSRERLRQTMRDEMRHHQQPFQMPEPTPLTRQSTQRDFELLRERSRLANRRMQTEEEGTGVSRVRRPGPGDQTGDSWNLAVLREALGQHSDRTPARPSNRPTTLAPESQRQGHEQQQMAENDAPAATAAAMGLTPTATTAAELPNLDHITQGILTLRTVLSTAALPPPAVDQAAEVSRAEYEAVELPEEVSEDDISSRLFTNFELEELVAAAERDFNDQTRGERVETEVPEATESGVTDNTSSAFTHLNEAIALVDRSIADATRVRDLATQSASALSSPEVTASTSTPVTVATTPTPTPAPESESATAAMSSPTGSPRRGRRRFFVGQWLDVKDTVNQWLECTVMDMSDEKVLVHYHGWPSRWDEWIDFDSDRIAAFRTRTQSTLFAPHLSPVPNTRLPNAPRTGDSSIRFVVPQLRDLMHEVMPHIDQLAALCEAEGEEDDDQRRETLSEMAHLMAPFFDRFGRVLVDSARQLDPFLRPELRQEERRHRHQRARSGNSSVNRQTPPNSSVEPPEDSAISVRDLITPAARPPHQDAAPARRSIDVHIHAIVAPSSLSSLASLARLGTAIAGAMGSSGGGSNTNTPTLRASNNPNELEDAFGLPRLRPVQYGSGDRSILTDITEPDEVDRGGRYRDTSRTPLLSASRRSPSSRSNGDPPQQSTGPAHFRVHRPARNPTSARLQDYLMDDFFGPSFSQDSDDMDDDDPLINGNGFSHRHDGEDEHDEVRYDEIPSPRDSEDSSHDDPGTPRVGVIPEVEEAERRHQQQLQAAANSESDAGRASSSSSSSSSVGYPTFLEVMRRTLSGVRNFGFSSSSTQSDTPATTATVAAHDTVRSDSEISSSSSSSSSSSLSSPTPTSAAVNASVSTPESTISTGFGPASSPQPSYTFGTPATLGSTASISHTTSSAAAQTGSGFTAYRSWGFESHSSFRPRQPSSTSDDDEEDLDSVD